MKHSILMTVVCAAMLLSSCSHKVAKTPYTETVYTIDYYSAGINGKVLLTEAPSVSFDYVSLGSIIVEAIDGYEVINTKTIVNTRRYMDSGDDIYGKPVENGETVVENEYGKFKKANPGAALRKASQAALDMGGDAIIGLKLTALSNTVPDSNGGVRTVIYGYSVTGMVVKRK